jgi:FkbM family methyltransferase
VVVIAAGAGRGLRLQVLPETPMTYALGIHEQETQTILERELKPGMVVYDCGANVGYFAVICARLVGSGGRVIAFEPSPGSVAALQAAPTLNDLLQLEVVARGLWRESGIVEFTRGAPGASLASDHVHGILGDAESSVATIRVPVVSLDTFVYDDGGPPPDFVKIDVEGAEGALLAGARRLLREQRPRILIEVHGEPGREAWRELRDAGYTCTDLATGRDPQSDDEFAGWLRQYLAVPRI